MCAKGESYINEFVTLINELSIIYMNAYFGCRVQICERTINIEGFMAFGRYDESCRIHMHGVWVMSYTYGRVYWVPGSNPLAYHQYCGSWFSSETSHVTYICMGYESHHVYMDKYLECRVQIRQHTINIVSRDSRQIRVTLHTHGVASVSRID